MSDTTKSRLQDIVQTKKQIDQIVQEKASAKQSEAEKAQTKRNLAKKYWETALEQIDAAIAFVNAEIAEAGLSLSAATTERNPSPALAQYYIKLLEGTEDTKCGVILNVSALGLVQAVIHITISPSRLLSGWKLAIRAHSSIWFISIRHWPG